MFPFRLTPAKYRPNVAVIVTDGQGRVLLCFRQDQEDKPIGVQTVQGGIDPGETAEQAAIREVYEEIGLKPGQFKILQASEKRYRYDWPHKFINQLRQTMFIGQEQQFFLFQVDPEVTFQLDCHNREFHRVVWGTPEELVKRAWKVKRPGLEGALREFGLLPNNVESSIV